MEKARAQGEPDKASFSDRLVKERTKGGAE